MEITIWIIIIALFILSIVGVFIPIIPAVAVIWIGYFLYHFFIDSEQLTLFFWIMMALFTIILVGADILTSRYFVNKFGGSKASEWGAIVGVIIGAFVYPPFGLMLVPFIIVFFIEYYLQKRSAKEASLASIGALAGFLSGVAAKIIIQLIMIIWFFIVVFI